MNKKLEDMVFEKLRDYVANAMINWGPDRHCDGYDTILYGVLRILGYDVPYKERYVSKVKVDKLVNSYIEELR